MKQIFNKFFLGALFILGFGFLFIPSHDVNANMLAAMEMNGGGGGGGGSGGGSSTTTATTPAYGTISLTVTPDKTTPYTASTDMVVSSTASVAVCSNTSLNLKVTGDITGPSTLNVGTLLDQKVVGNQTLAGNSTIVIPSTPGDYVFNITATRYDQSGYVLREGSSLSVPITNVSSYKVENGSEVFYIDTNYRGRITKIKDTNGYDVDIYALLYETLTADNGYGATSLSVASIGEEAIKTYSISFNFSVVAPTPVASTPLTVTVSATNLDKTPQETKASALTVPKDTSVQISWSSSTNATSCKCTYYKDDTHPDESCGSGIGQNVPGATLTLAESKTFTVTCKDNSSTCINANIGFSCNQPGSKNSISAGIDLLDGPADVNYTISVVPGIQYNDYTSEGSEPNITVTIPAGNSGGGGTRIANRNNASESCASGSLLMPLRTKVANSISISPSGYKYSNATICR